MVLFRVHVMVDSGDPTDSDSWIFTDEEKARTWFENQGSSEPHLITLEKWSGNVDEESGYLTWDVIEEREEG